jgi:type VI secretion system ImpM family protein
VPSVGLFGKLPSTGDFVSRGFSGQLLESLDGMIQAALFAACAEGATRGSLKSTAPGLVINIRPGALCRTGFLGSITPSCDRVGRFFPLCLGLETDPAPPEEPLAWVSLALSAKLIQLGYEANSQSIAPDQVQKRLPEAELCARLARADQPFLSALDATLPSMPLSTTQFAFEGPEQRMSTLNRAVCLRLPLLAQALGSVVTTPTQNDLFFATRCLSTPSKMAALFDGRWQDWGWSLQPRLESDDDGEDSLAQRDAFEGGQASLRESED